ncbi:hypothetical protein C2845_PM03G24070 [Panicum miliaceum]|uniref:Uncharacterized protein n=1 Tax=Panicum miliaceum TaxID=4540 RepID=A0A3L6T6I0_PANMI|nr:hypothetical protein C2845_PM03G24070 [Panicum miliaceum]
MASGCVPDIWQWIRSLPEEDHTLCRFATLDPQTNLEELWMRSAMIMEHPSRLTKDEKLLFLGHDSSPPWRVSLRLTPMAQPDILSLSVSRSTDNPVHEVGQNLGALPGAVPASIGVGVSAHEAVTLRPWKFEHAGPGNTASLGWFLQDSASGREVFCGEPRGPRLPRPRSWLRGRYTGPGRPFTRSGGVIFAGDEYGEGVCWRMRPAAAGRTVEWEVRARVWATYWPNKKRTPLHTETRMLQVRELLHLTVAE